MTEKIIHLITRQTTNLQGIEITLQRDNLLTSLECLESKTRDKKKRQQRLGKLNKASRAADTVATLENSPKILQNVKQHFFSCSFTQEKASQSSCKHWTRMAKWLLPKRSSKRNGSNID